jgi:hypothetical protein
LSFGDFLNSALMAVACVAQYDIKPTEFLVGFANGVEDFLAIRDVEGDWKNRVPELLDQRCESVGIPRRHSDVVASLEGGPGPEQAEASCRAGDEPDLFHISHVGIL